MSKKTFIFDLDGVIVDTAKFHFIAWKNLAEGLGIPFSEEQNEQLKGVSRIVSLEKILAWGNKEISSADFEALLVSKNEEYLKYVHQMDESEILPGVLERLQQLKNEKYKVALGSASKNARLILEKVGLMPYFDEIVDGNEVTKAKPDPEVFLKAASLLGSEPKDCIVFEDSLAGVQAANTAKMISVGVGDANILNEADFNIQTFEDIDNQLWEALLSTTK